MESITTAVSEMFGFVGTAITQVTSQPILCVFFAAGLIPIAIGIFRKLECV